MEAKTIVRSFSFFFIVLTIALMGEYLYCQISGAKHHKPHEIFPITSIPKWVKLYKTGIPGDPASSTAQPHENVQVSLRLKNGNEVKGTLLSEELDWVTVKLGRSDVGFHRSEIEEIRKELPAGTD